MTNIATETLNLAASTLSLYSTFLFSFMFALLTVFAITRKLNGISIAVTLIITGIVFLLASSATGQNLEGSLPSTTYPVPPHLGLGDVSLQNWYPSTIPSY